MKRRPSNPSPSNRQSTTLSAQTLETGSNDMRDTNLLSGRSGIRSISKLFWATLALYLFWLAWLGYVGIKNISAGNQ